MDDIMDVPTIKELMDQFGLNQADATFLRDVLIQESKGGIDF
jgi:hypothetical protein